MLNNID